MKKLIAIVALLSAGAAPAADLKYDPGVNAGQRTLETLLYRTVRCMESGAVNMVRQGQTDVDALAQWLATTCGLPLGRFMVSDMGYTQNGAAEYLFNMGRLALVYTPGVTIK